MITQLKRYVRQHLSYPVKDKEAIAAYDLWAEGYDNQPGNLMLDLDEQLVSSLLEHVDLVGKNIADIGCGTGRHWAKLQVRGCAQITGFDVSPGMLGKLKQKYPSAKVYTITDNRFGFVDDQTFDVLLSALTIAHIENMEEAIYNWCRILKNNADIVITDFHPDALAKGGKRTFEYHHKQVSVKNYVHFTDTVKDALLKNGFRMLNEITVKVDDTVRHYYTAKNALAVYERFKNTPIIYGIHFRRGER